MPTSSLSVAAAAAIAAHNVDETDALAVRADQVDSLPLSVVGGSVAGVAGKFGNAASFTAGVLTSGVVLPAVSMYRGWFKPSSLQVGNGLIFRNGSSGAHQVSLSWTALGGGSGAVNLTAANGGGGGGVGLVGVAADSWHLFHIWLTTGPALVNFALDAGATLSIALTAPVPTQPIDVGGDWNGVAISDQYLGQIDDLVLGGGGQFLDDNGRAADWSGGAGVVFAEWHEQFPADGSLRRANLLGELARAELIGQLGRGGPLGQMEGIP